MTHSNIATAINAAHAGVEVAKREGARYAVECGRLLAQAKDTVPHGGWDAWLRLNTTVSPRTAQLYMRIARHVEGDAAKAQRVAGLSVRDVAAEATGSRRATASRKPMSPEVEHDFRELKQVWDEAKDNPDWQEGAARELFRIGYITKPQRNGIIRSVLAKHYAHLTDADRKEAAKRGRVDGRKDPEGNAARTHPETQEFSGQRYRDRHGRRAGGTEAQVDRGSAMILIRADRSYFDWLSLLRCLQRQPARQFASSDVGSNAGAPVSSDAQAITSRCTIS